MREIDPYSLKLVEIPLPDNYSLRKPVTQSKQKKMNINKFNKKIYISS